MLSRARCISWIVFTAAFLPLVSQAQLTLPPLFTDHAVLQRDKPITIHGHANPKQQVDIVFDGKTVTSQADKNGLWKVVLPAHAVGGPYTLDVTAGKEHLRVEDLLLGDVWLASGQSNMHFTMRPFAPWTEGVLNYEQEIANAQNPNVRFFTVPEEASYPEKQEENGLWQVMSPATACNVSGIAYFFAQELSRQTGVPIGIVSASVGATSISSWMESSRLDSAVVERNEVARASHIAEIAAYQQALPAYYADSRKVLSSCSGAPVAFHNQPIPNFLFQDSGCYNAMISPLREFAIKGVIWYQGEGDARNFTGYAGRMSSLIENWRSNWHDPELPFYYVQLANRDFRAIEALHKGFKEGNFSSLRYEQFDALAIPHTGMAVATDVGDPTLIHPRDKKTVGQRLALQALRKTYGKDVIADGPLFSSFEVNGDKLTLHFTTNGSPLVNRTGSAEPAGFEIAGADGIYVPAFAEIHDDTIVLSSKVVAAPAHARYAWGDDPRLSLYNDADLPAASFKTK